MGGGGGGGVYYYVMCFLRTQSISLGVKMRGQQEHLDRDGEDEDEGEGQRRLSRHDDPQRRQGTPAGCR